MSARAFLIIVLAALLAGCSIQSLRNMLQLSRGSQSLEAGVRHYENGEYPDAARNFQAALDFGLSDAERARAYKYLAFIHCSSGRERACRDAFRKALTADPSLQLGPAEAGHPVWGPIFASVKASSSPFKIALQQYEEGDYDNSAKSFQDAIKAGLDDKDLANAHKHLAFIHCAANRERQCRDEFRKALAVDPAFDLDPAEAGHPVWGPVFRSVRAER